MRISSYLLGALCEVADVRQTVQREALQFASEYGEEAWAKLPDQIATAVATLIHSTYSEETVPDVRWARWRRQTREELDGYLAECGPIRKIK
jgi:hypothetical protein